MATVGNEGEELTVSQAGDLYALTIGYTPAVNVAAYKVIGTADEFWISLTKKSENNLDLETHSEIADNNPGNNATVDLASISNSVDLLRSIANSFKYPLWLIFIALLIIILK